MTKQDNLYNIAAAAAASQHPSSLNVNHHHFSTVGRHPFDNTNIGGFVTNNTVVNGDHLNSNGVINQNSSALHHHHHHHNLHLQSNVNPLTATDIVVQQNAANPFYNAFYAASHHSPSAHHHHHAVSQMSHHHHNAAMAAAAVIQQHQSAAAAAAAASSASVTSSDIEIDPRELETFAERFKQRRIKLGVTQADVGQQLSKLKLPGVGSLSQSTICRFESLTLSHNNMVALKPVLQSWLEQAEQDARMKRKNEEVMSISSSTTNSSNCSSIGSLSSSNNNNNNNNNGNINLNGNMHSLTNGLDRNCNNSVNGNSDRKRKRTSIAAPEKRSLEAFFSVQPRPSGEKIAQIAEKLDLKKNVVRVWFCNQRQKQKRN
jgi:class 4 POU domain transcription factor